VPVVNFDEFKFETLLSAVFISLWRKTNPQITQDQTRTVSSLHREWNQKSRCTNDEGASFLFLQSASGDNFSGVVGTLSDFNSI
jgi:hypothetical protein